MFAYAHSKLKDVDVSWSVLKGTFCIMPIVKLDWYITQTDLW